MLEGKAWMLEEAGLVMDVDHRECVLDECQGLRDGSLYLS